MFIIMKAINICASDNDGLWELRNTPNKYQKNPFSGQYSPVMNQLVDDFGLYLDFNISIVKGDGQNLTRPNGDYGGCIGLMQSGEAHLMYGFVPFPELISNVTSGQYVYD